MTVRIILILIGNHQAPFKSYSIHILPLELKICRSPIEILCGNFWGHEEFNWVIVKFTVLHLFID